MWTKLASDRRVRYLNDFDFVVRRSRSQNWAVDVFAANAETPLTTFRGYSNRQSAERKVRKILSAGFVEVPVR